MRAALEQLADQDPLIDVRADDDGRATVSLYGRVQQEVIGATLADDHGIEVTFADAAVLHVERPRPARDMPLYLFKSAGGFSDAIARHVRRSLRVGRHGWAVTDCVVTLTECAYSTWDGPPSRRGPTSTSYDYRQVTPLVLRQALGRAGTVVCEPVLRVTLEVPTGAAAGLQRQLPDLTGGEGVLESRFGGYRPVKGRPVVRRARGG